VIELRKFDLNVEKVLENWEISHAIREIIANALDEQVLTNSTEIQIYKDGNGSWHIRDAGRGLKYQHFTQNENKEKLDHEGLIGRFGVGLKDALATLYRRGVNVEIQSSNGKFSLSMETKENFPDITTLHVLVEDLQSGIAGTDFALKPVTKADIDTAKSFFLKFSNATLLETTDFGQVYSCEKGKALIFVNGVKVAEENNFLFSYNITSMTAAMKRALNRERTHVGRTAYTDRVKSILLTCSGEKVIRALVADIELMEKGLNSDETSWIDVAQHAIGHLNKMDKVVFVTPKQGIERGDLILNAKLDGYRVVFINETIAEKIRGSLDPAGNPIRDLTQYQVEYNESFQYKFVDPEVLTSPEKDIFQKKDRILELAGGKPSKVKLIKISETMRIGNDAGTAGVWEPSQNMIVIKRTQLNSLSSFAGTLIHEMAHAKSGCGDSCLGFEMALTEILGLIASKGL
jgi:hypothetical protein